MEVGGTGTFRGPHLLPRPLQPISKVALIQRGFETGKRVIGIDARLGENIAVDLPRAS